MNVMTMFRSTLGKKYIMAATGVVLFGFVFFHMLGNLQVFLGPGKLNQYAAVLHHTPSLLWGTRAILTVAVLAHMATAIQLAQLRRRARPVGYAAWRPVESTVPSRTMIFSGAALFFFVAYHLLDLTVGVAHPGGLSPNEDVYANIISGFSRPVVSAVYILAMISLGLHMRHGVWSVFQSLGVNSPRTNGAYRKFANGLTLLVVFGNISIPVGVLTGVIRQAAN